MQSTDAKRKYGDRHLRPGAILFLGAAAILSFVILMNVAYIPLRHISFRLSSSCSLYGRVFGGRLGCLPVASYPMYLNHWMGAFVAHGVAKRVDFIPPLAEGLLSYVGWVVAGITAYLIVEYGAEECLLLLYVTT